MGEKSSDPENIDYGVLDRISVPALKEFTNLIRDSSGTILWAIESGSNRNETGITALLPGVWTGKEVVPNVEITGFVSGENSESYRKILQESLPACLEHIPESSTFIIYDTMCTYRHEGREYPFLEFISLPEEEPRKKFIRERNIRIGIPESYWKWRKVIIRSLQTREKRRETMKEEQGAPATPAAVPEQSATGKGVSQETPEPEGPVKPPAPEPAGNGEQKQGKKQQKGAMKAPFAGNKKKEEDTSELAEDDCIACKGTGTSSTGKNCKPCGGTGKRPSASPGSKEERNGQETKQSESQVEGTSESQKNNEESGSESKTGQEEKKTSPESSGEGAEAGTEEQTSSGETSSAETQEQGENKEESADQGQASSGGGSSESKSGQVKAKPSAKKKKKRSSEEVKQDKIREVEEMGFDVKQKKNAEDMSLEKLASDLQELSSRVSDISEQVQIRAQTPAPQEALPEDREEQMELVEKILPDDPSERMKFLSELMAK